MKIVKLKQIINHPTAVALLVLFTGLFIHFWYIFFNFNHSLYGGPGDHTAGLIWLYEQDPASPWWSFTNKSAFPFGDSLWNPTFILGQAYYILFWILATVFHSGIAGYNALMIAGVAISFWLVYRFLIRFTSVDNWIAAIFAYCCIFNPFLLSLIGVGHLTYVFSSAFVIGLLHLLYRTFIDDSSLKRYPIFLGMMVGSTWLVDPYFVLFAGLLVLGWLVGLILYQSKCHGAKYSVRKDIKKIGYIGTSALMMFVPLLIFSQINADSLKKNTLDVRSDIRVDVGLYSTRIKDLLLPSESNPFLPKSIREYKLNTYHGKNPTFTTYIGWTTMLLGLLVIAAGLFSSEYKVKLRRMNVQEKAFIITITFSILILLAFSFPTKISVNNISIYTPTELLVSLSGIWRVLARSYIFYLPIIFIILAVCIAKLKKVKNLRWTYVLAVVLVMLMPVDFLNRNVFDSKKFYDLQRDLPATYRMVKSDNHIQSIAEYPLREAPHYRGSMYFTGQLYHEKKLFNSIVTVTNQTYVREALMDLNNPQTLRSLSFLGVDAIHVWNNSTQQWNGTRRNGLTSIAKSNYPNMFGDDKTELYRLSLPEIYKVKGRYVLVPQWDARMTNGEYLYDVFQTIPKEAGMKVVDLCSMVELKMCKSPESSRDTFKGYITFQNDSENIREVQISIDGTSDNYRIPPKGKLQVSFDKDIKLDTMIKMDTQDAEGVSVYGYHLE